jgi:hypothetical protein
MASTASGGSGRGRRTLLTSGIDVKRSFRMSQLGGTPTHWGRAGNSGNWPETGHFSGTGVSPHLRPKRPPLSLRVAPRSATCPRCDRGHSQALSFLILLLAVGLRGRAHPTKIQKSMNLARGWRDQRAERRRAVPLTDEGATMRSLSDPNNPLDCTNPTSPNGWTNPFSPTNLLGHGRLIQPSMHKSRGRCVPPTGWSSHHSVRAEGSLVVVARLAVFALVLTVCPASCMPPTPPKISSARQFVTSSIESAGGLAPPDVARSIDAFIPFISR